MPLGATVLGTGMGQMPGYGEAVIEELSSVLGWQVHWPVWDKEVIEDSAVFDSMQNCDETMVLAGLLKALCCAAARISKDLCIYASGPDHGFNEIFLQPYEGRRPSFIPELMIELMQRSVAFDQVATLTVNENDGDEAINDSASFVNAMELLESMKNAFALFSVHCIDTLQINGVARERKCRDVNIISNNGKRTFWLRDRDQNCTQSMGGRNFLQGSRH